MRPSFQLVIRSIHYLHKLNAQHRKLVTVNGGAAVWEHSCQSHTKVLSEPYSIREAIVY